MVDMAFRRIFRRPRMRTMLLFSTVLAVLCFVIVVYPTSNTAIQKTFETQQSSTIVEGRRKEYYVLNRNFFDFLSSTRLECLIQVEPDEEGIEEASVKTKLIDNDLTTAEQSFEKAEMMTKADSINIPGNSSSFEPKYILVYRHFEQLSKTTENLLQLAAISKRWGRLIVQPDVQNSRFSLEPEFRAYPLETYFNVTSLNELLMANGYSRLVKIRNFTKDCSHAAFGVKTTLVHFLYGDTKRGNTKSWFHINDKELRAIVDKSLPDGWTQCDFINRHLSVGRSIKGIQIGRQVCVNPEVLTTEEAFEDKVLQGDKCVIFVEWRGLGKHRTHFQPRFSPFLSPNEVKHRISSSNLIHREVTSFLQSKLPSKYISVHLRTERLFVANLYKKLQSCIEHVVYLVSILRSLRGAEAVFLATDLTEFGTDLFQRQKFYIKTATGEYLIRREEIADIHTKLERRLNAVTYKPTSEPFSKDKGVFSLVEMNILKGGMDLIMLGRGTFHTWILNVFKQHQARVGRRGYTLSEVCVET